VRPEIPDKIYFRIGEVAELLEVETYVLRYWESEFPLIKPVRTASNQRLFRQQDLETFMEIKRLLYDEKFTIAGAQKKISPRSKSSEPTTQEKSEELLDFIKNSLADIKHLLSGD
jgi:DNA-binding transcriptional MerR regulator